MLPERQELDLAHATPRAASRTPQPADAEITRAPCEEPPPGAFRPVDGPMRTFCDREGLHWRVYVASSAGDDKPSLVFESIEGVRRIRCYPAGWLALSERDLECLSWAH
jgi:hypothetical protein